MSVHVETRYVLRSLASLVLAGAASVACHPQTNPNSLVSGRAFEAFPWWGSAQITVGHIATEPERVRQGEMVTLSATLENRGPASARGTVAFFVDAKTVGREESPRIGAGGRATIRAAWRAAGPGRHSVRAVFVPAARARAIPGADNWAESAVWVAGEENPMPDLQLSTMDFEDSPVAPGGPAVIPFKVHNPSFATTATVPIRFSVDGALLAQAVVRSLEPGETQEFQVTWPAPTAGQHVLRADFGRHDISDPAPPSGGPRESLPQPSPPPPPGASSWVVSIPGPSSLYTYPAAAKDQWASMGPSILADGNAGRMEDLVFDTHDDRIAYGVSEVGGIWKTTNFGVTWMPVGDKLPTLNFVKIAVDPNRPEIVYAASRDEGIWKSIDGGRNWSPFATGTNDLRLTGVRALLVRHRSLEQDEVVVYVGCDLGLFEYANVDPSALRSTFAEWKRLMTDPVWDLAIHPNNPSYLWASVNRMLPNGVQEFDRVVVRQGLASPWQTGQGLPGQGLARIAVAPLAPNIVYSAILFPAVNKELAIYRSVDKGLTWRFVCDYQANGGDYWKVMYNPFIRVDPDNPLVVYVAGTQLYRVDVNKALTGNSDHTSLVNAGHPDIKQLVFLKSALAQQQGRAFWVLSDGGVWWVPQLGSLTHRNGELRTIQFYDLASSAADSHLMLGGTQDNGTLRYRGFYIWEDVGPEGDGNRSLVSPTGNRMYGQGQFLDSLYRTDNGLDKKPSWQAVGGSGSNALPKDVWDGFMTLDSGDDAHVLTVGDQVYETKNAGGDWARVGPVAELGHAPVRGVITRVLFQPGTNSDTWMAGTSEGQVWYHRKAGWIGIDEHEDAAGNIDAAAVTSMAFSPADSRVLWAVFATSDRDRRIYRYEQKGNFWGPGLAIGSGFPRNVTPRVICGDPTAINVVYVGTDNGVYRGETVNYTDYVWAPYNEGLPLARVTALLVDHVSRELRAGTNGRGAWAVRTR